MHDPLPDSEASDELAMGVFVGLRNVLVIEAIAAVAIVAVVALLAAILP